MESRGSSGNCRLLRGRWLFLLLAGGYWLFCKGSFLAKFQKLALVHTSKDLNQPGDETSPTGLVAGSQTGTVVTVEILEEK